MRAFLITLMLAGPAFAARMWSSGFEQGSVVEWNACSTSTNAPTFSATTKRSGGYAMRCNGWASGQRCGCAQQLYSSANAGPGIARFWINTAVRPSYGVMLGAFQTGGAINSTIVVGVMLDENGKLQLINGDGVTTYGSLSPVIALNEWHRVDIYYDATGGAGATVVKGRLDGTEWASVTNATFSANPTGFRVGLNMWGEGQAVGDIYIDDVAYNDAAGSYENSWPSATGKIVHLQPNGAGDVTASISLGGSSAAGTAWESVDEIAPDDYVTIASMTATASIMDVALQDHGTPGIGDADAVDLVALGARVHAASASNCTWVPGLKSQASGIVSSGTTTTIAAVAFNNHDDTVAAKQYKLTQYVNPQAGSGAITTSLLDSMQARIYTTDASPVVGVTSVWALVEYRPATPSGGGGGRKRIQLVN